MKGIAQKLITWMIAATVAVLAILGAMEYHAGLMIIDRKIDENLKVISHRLAISLRNSVYEFDTATALDTVQAEFPNPDVAAIMVWTQERQRLICGLERRGNELHNIVNDPEGEHLVSTHRLLYIESSTDNSKVVPIGEVYVYLDRSKPKKRLIGAVWQELGKISLMVVLLLILLVTIANHFIVTPLENIRHAMEEIRSSALDTSSIEAWNGSVASFSVRSLSSGFSELKQMGQIFYRMVEAIRSRQNALQESEEKYRLLIKSLPSIVYRGYKDWSVEFIDRKVELLTGFDVDEFNSRKMKWSDIIFKEDIEPAKGHFIRALKTDKSYVREYRIKSKDGNLRWIQERGHIVCDNRGEIEYVSGVFFDITETKELEDQLQQAHKMESIGTLAGGIAHDFNNILSSVFGFTELALDDAKKGTLQHKNLQEVLIAGNRAKDLVQQILTFSRQADQEEKPVQVKLVVKEALKLLRASIPSTIEIEQNIQTNALVMGDSTQIHQVLMNLCTNAAHAMEDKGGLLTINLSDLELDSEFISNHPELKPGPYINLTVTDTGHGIPPAVLEKIFDPFFTTKEIGEGSGMGLSVVHGIVHSHAGTIYVYSEPGKGSTFKVFLPSLERHLKPEDRIERPIPTGTERILFIDDEPAIVNMGKQILESLGYDVVTRTSSIEALELFKAQKGRFDLVITDMTMPHMTGENLAKEIMQIRLDMPVILCTGFSVRIDKKKAMDMGIRAFISKPILKREIAEIIRTILDG